jgi:hypothetical protein
VGEGVGHFKKPPPPSLNSRLAENDQRRHKFFSLLFLLEYSVA